MHVFTDITNTRKKITDSKIDVISQEKNISRSLKNGLIVMHELVQLGSLFLDTDDVRHPSIEEETTEYPFFRVPKCDSFRLAIKSAEKFLITAGDVRSVCKLTFSLEQNEAEILTLQTAIQTMTEKIRDEFKSLIIENLAIADHDRKCNALSKPDSIELAAVILNSQLLAIKIQKIMKRCNNKCKRQLMNLKLEIDSVKKIASCISSHTNEERNHARQKRLLHVLSLNLEKTYHSLLNIVEKKIPNTDLFYIPTQAAQRIKFRKGEIAWTLTLVKIIMDENGANHSM